MVQQALFKLVEHALTSERPILSNQVQFSKMILFTQRSICYIHILIKRYQCRSASGFRAFLSAMMRFGGLRNNRDSIYLSENQREIRRADVEVG